MLAARLLIEDRLEVGCCCQIARRAGRSPPRDHAVLRISSGSGVQWQVCPLGLPTLCPFLKSSLAHTGFPALVAASFSITSTSWKRGICLVPRHWLYSPDFWRHGNLTVMDLREQDRLHSPRRQRPESKIKFRRICRFKKVIVVEAGVGLIAKVRMLSGRGRRSPTVAAHITCCRYPACFCLPQNASTTITTFGNLDLEPRACAPGLFLMHPFGVVSFRRQLAGLSSR